MRKLGIGLVLVLLTLPARAREDPDTVERKADAILAACDAGDAHALWRLANDGGVDSWLVAEELCQRGEIPSAWAFAFFARHPDSLALPDYVASWKARAVDGEVLEAAQRARDHLACFGGESCPLE